MSPCPCLTPPSSSRLTPAQSSPSCHLPRSTTSPRHIRSQPGSSPLRHTQMEYPTAPSSVVYCLAHLPLPGNESGILTPQDACLKLLLTSCRINWVGSHPEGSTPFYSTTHLSAQTNLRSNITFPGVLFSSHCTFCISFCPACSWPLRICLRVNHNTKSILGWSVCSLSLSPPFPLSPPPPHHDDPLKV